jgi:hypothetical protein
MALDDTKNAIGAVTQALKNRIDFFSGTTVTVGRPDQHTGTNPHLNLFLYEIAFDPHLKNTLLNEGEKAPLWMVLKYLLTAFESTDESDSIEAHEHLGRGLRVVYRDDLLKLTGLPTNVVKALDPNPSELHVTFDESPTDLMAKLMQGPDSKLRLSICFQVRPVMIASGEPGDYSLLVGVDYTKDLVAPNFKPTLVDPYVGIDVIPSMGSFISEISPKGFEVGEEVTISGTDMHLANLSVMLGPVELPVTMQQPDQLKFAVDPAIIAASAISAGSHPVTVVQTLPGTGKKRKSNTVIGNLVPTLNTVVVGAAVIDDPGPPIKSHRDFDLTGALLGLDSDDTILAFYRNGAVLEVFDLFTPLPASPPPGQLTRQLVLKSNDEIPAGDYYMILIVNGQQTPQSPKITLAAWP